MFKLNSTMFYGSTSEYLKIAVHNGLFHADEMVALLLLRFAGWEGEYVRTRTEFKGVTIALDVTPRNIEDVPVIWDHHSSAKNAAWYRPNQRRYASAGWIWHLYGRDILKERFSCPEDRVETAFSNLDKAIFEGIDSLDNGEEANNELPLWSISQIVSSYNCDDISNEEKQNAEFKRCSSVVQSILWHAIHTEVNRQKEFAHIWNLCQNQKDSNVLVLDKGGAWTSVFLEKWEETKHFKIVIYPDAAAKGQWRIQTAPGSKDNPMEQRCSAPTLLKGKREGELGGQKLVFIHPNGFIGGVFADSADKAVKAAKMWISLRQFEEVMDFCGDYYPHVEEDKLILSPLGDCDAEVYKITKEVSEYLKKYEAFWTKRAEEYRKSLLKEAK